MVKLPFFKNTKDRLFSIFQFWPTISISFLKLYCGSCCSHKIIYTLWNKTWFKHCQWRTSGYSNKVNCLNSLHEHWISYLSISQSAICRLICIEHLIYWLNLEFKYLMLERLENGCLLDFPLSSFFYFTVCLAYLFCKSSPVDLLHSSNISNNISERFFLAT